MESVQRIANLVVLEKCCKMRIWVQKSASMQKRTSRLKFGDLAEKSGFNSVSNLSTKAATRGSPPCRRAPASPSRSAGPRWPPSRPRARRSEPPASPGGCPAPRSSGSGAWRPSRAASRPACRSPRRSRAPRKRTLVERFDTEFNPDFSAKSPIFRGLVLFYIEADFCTQIRICSIFRELQDLQSFAPLQFQNLS